jgi:signal transduction histidine kinase
MQEMWKSFFTSGPFIPHDHCYLWHTPLVWLHLASDSIIALAYFSISITLVYFISKREDLPFDWIFAMFGGFIVACGITHIFEVWTLWHPTYWVSGTIKAITAMISFATAILLVDLMPQALALPSPAQLESANRLLEAEIVERQLAETALKQAKNELQIIVEERTAKLKLKTQELDQALSELKQDKSKLNQSETMSDSRELALRVAHEIKNPICFVYGNLTVISEYAHSLLEILDIYQEQYPNPLRTVQEKIDYLELDFIREDLPQILISMKDQAGDLLDIVKSLRTFSFFDKPGFKLADIHQGIDSTLMLLQKQMKSKPGFCSIKIIKEYGNLQKIECHPQQLKQVFIDIIANAIDALE